MSAVTMLHKTKAVKEAYGKNEIYACVISTALILKCIPCTEVKPHACFTPAKHMEFQTIKSNGYLLIKGNKIIVDYLAKPSLDGSICIL